ncbi:ClpP-like prohead protease/major capsid protein fusion protein [Vibrio splendidus]|uniref:ClpP-like prohead protease/major capsid protein fusion protein n=1 Tax=Vibrio splendidus TaxID=29497 RepID=UPI000C815CE9|nr:ClpP-like prohead protease/major capsid protein fusion protein [Vibrio splendidus]PMI49565.1 ATP-dependent protease [Vibrio splendidus]
MPKPENKSWYSLKNYGENEPVKVWIHGDVGRYDIEAIDLIRALQAVATQDVTFHIQSYGGSVYEGLAMFNAIKAHKGKTVAVVDGVAASISSYYPMACDEIQMPENATMMIHDPNIGAWGGEKELESALAQLKNAKQTIADAYVEKTGKGIDAVLEAMNKETWFTAVEALEFGLVDKVIDPVNMENCLQQVDGDALKAFKNLPESLSNQLNALGSESSEPEPVNHSSSTPPLTQAPTNQEPEQVTDMPQPNKTELQNAVKQENQRQAKIRELCALHSVGEELKNEMLNDADCSVESASAKILSNLGSQSANGQQEPTAAVSPTIIHAGNGNHVKDELQNALNARLGTETIEGKNTFASDSLLNMAKASLGNKGFGLGKQDLVARAFNSGDFADVLTEGVRTVIREEAKVKPPLWQQIATTENMPDFRETDLVTINDAPDLMGINEDGEYKSALIKGSGEKIQLATYGREFRITRQAIINDEIALLSKVPRKFFQSGRRLADKLMINAILTGKMGDGKSVFDGKNLETGVAKGDYAALILALHKSIVTAETSGGDAMDLDTHFLLASHDHAPMLEAVLKTASKPDSFNPAFNKFQDLIATGRMSGVNGAIGLTSKDFETVVMGFLDGQQDPWLETGDGFTSDGAKMRITYDLTAKVTDRRGIAKATFAN